MAFYLLNPFLLMQHDLEFRNTKDFSGSKKINKSNLIYFQYPIPLYAKETKNQKKFYSVSKTYQIQLIELYEMSSHIFKCRMHCHQ